MKKNSFFLVSTAFLFMAAGLAQGLDKIRLASPIKVSPPYYLPALAGQQQGIWKGLGLEMDWVPFSASSIYYHAFSANQVDLGMGRTLADWRAASRGVPIIIISNLMPRGAGFSIWVPADSRFVKPEDVKGIKLGVSSLVGPEYAHGKLIVRALKREEGVKFVATGGISQSLAALKVGSVDGVVLTISQMVNLKIKGEVREYLSAEDYLPRAWVDYVVTAHKNLVASKPEMVRRSVKAFMETTHFIKNNRAWALEKMKEMHGYSPAAAELIFKNLDFATEARIERQALENVRQFVIEYGFVTAAEALPVDKIYDPRFAQ